MYLSVSLREGGPGTRGNSTRSKKVSSSQIIRRYKFPFETPFVPVSLSVPETGVRRISESCPVCNQSINVFTDILMLTPFMRFLGSN